MTLANGRRLAPMFLALGLIASGVTCGSAAAQNSPSPANPAVVVLHVAFRTAQTTASSDLAAKACSPATQGVVAEEPTLSATDASGLAAQLTTALSQNIRKSGRLILRDFSDAPSGTLVVASCIVRADPGDPGKRLVGMGMGASVLAVHVQVYGADQAHRDLVGEFDTEVRGENKLPPLGPVGLAVHGIRGHGLTLAADADKLAKLVAQRVIAGQYRP